MLHDPAIMALQNRIVAMEDPDCGADAAAVTLRLNDGRTHMGSVDHCIGSAGNPMTDAQLEAKFTALGDPVVGAVRCRELIALCHDLDRLADAGAIARGAA